VRSEEFPLTLASTSSTPAPRVSVIIPTRARPELLRQAIASARAQTITDLEIIVAVNGPENPLTARTLEIASGCRVVRVERAGIAVALNAGIAIARGEWLAFLDDDDLWEPNRIEAALEAARLTSADLVISDFVVFDDSGGVQAPARRPPPGMPMSEAWTRKTYSGCSAAFARRSAVAALGGFDEDLTGPDWDLWMRLAWHGPVAWTDGYLVWIRHHTENASKHLSWARQFLRTQWKAFRTLPRELRYLRVPLAWEMLKVVSKASESFVRRKFFRRGRPTAPLAGKLRPPVASEPAARKL
jgi:glycosyltransferase involved in cell wall biosynthesis